MTFVNISFPKQFLWPNQKEKSKSFKNKNLSYTNVDITFIHDSQKLETIQTSFNGEWISK